MQLIRICQRVPEERPVVRDDGANKKENDARQETNKWRKNNKMMFVVVVLKSAERGAGKVS